MRILIFMVALLLLTACRTEIPTPPLEPEIPADITESEPNVTEPEPVNASPPVIQDVPPAPKEGEGEIVVTITDDAVNLEDLSSLVITVRGVMLHDQARQEWVTLDVSPQQFDLLQLKRKEISELVVRAPVPASLYDKVQLSFGEVEAVMQGSAGSAKMPSKVFKAAAEVTVASQQVSAIMLDVIADESMHMTQQGRLIFAPVVQIETRKGVTVTGSGTSAIVAGGQTINNLRFGMSADGSVGVGKSIPADVELSYEMGKVIVRERTQVERRISDTSKETPEGYDYQESTLGDYDREHTACSIRYTGGNCY